MNPFTLAPLFQDHAVLQRDVPLPVWGRAAAGSEVQVRLGSAKARTTATADGFWRLRLPPQPAGGPFEMCAVCGGEELRLRDLLLGDVWICSGQSNMEFALSESEDPDQACVDIADSDLRVLNLKNPATAEAQTAVNGKWQRGTEAALLTFSAVGAWFGHSLRRELGVPVGLICNAWGGTRIQAWLSREALAGDPAGRDEIDFYEPLLYRELDPSVKVYANPDEWFRAEGPEDPVDQGRAAGWHLPETDDTGWERMRLPRRWQDAGHAYSGIFWFRRRVRLPDAWRNQPLCLNLGAIDKHDHSYVNGVKVGEMGWETPNAWCTPREYKLPAGLADAAGELCIAVRVRSHMFHGGMTGPARAMTVHPEGCPEAALPLDGDWAMRIEQNWGVVEPPPGKVLTGGRGPGSQNAPYTLFNSRLAPLIPYGIRGWIWYQGESNATEARLYRRLLPLMIADWRRAWGQGNLPFLQVQLANFLSVLDQPGPSDWAELRQAQADAMRLPAVGMSNTIDIGDADDIHPKNKKDVGLRLARWALSEVYGVNIPPCGPLLRGMRKVSGNRLRLEFRQAAGLCTRNEGEVRELAVAGPDRVFVWAESRIVESELEVWHPEIPTPCAVRYAWANNPASANLVNGAGLPAYPFCTDALAASSLISHSVDWSC